MSIGGRIITLGFDKEFGDEEPIKIKSITLASILFIDLQPILNLFGENIHLGKGIYFGQKLLFMPPLLLGNLIDAPFSRRFFATFSRCVFQ